MGLDVDAKIRHQATHLFFAAGDGPSYEALNYKQEDELKSMTIRAPRVCRVEFVPMSEFATDMESGNPPSLICVTFRSANSFLVAVVHKEPGDVTLADAEMGCPPWLSHWSLGVGKKENIAA